MKSLTVSEIFGPTVQGEGPLIGRPCSFLRLMACNQHCVWCDTPYTWDGSRYDLKAEGRKMTTEDVATSLADIGQALVIVSGGEPMLQQSALVELWRRLHGVMSVPRMQVETAGTIAPDPDFTVSFVVSPKLAHSGNDLRLRRNMTALRALHESGRVVAWKFVVQDVHDFAEIDDIVGDLGIMATDQAVWVMPEGRDAEVLRARLPVIIPAAIEHGYRVTPRLHVDAWGDERGR